MCKTPVIYKTMWDVYGKANPSSKVLKSMPNISLLQRAWVKKRVQEVETEWLSSKEKVPGAAFRKDDFDSVLEH